VKAIIHLMAQSMTYIKPEREYQGKKKNKWRI